MANKGKDFADSYEQMRWCHATRRCSTALELREKYVRFIVNFKSSDGVVAYVQRRIDAIDSEIFELRKKYPKYL